MREFVSYVCNNIIFNMKFRYVLAIIFFSFDQLSFYVLALKCWSRGLDNYGNPLIPIHNENMPFLEADSHNKESVCIAIRSSKYKTTFYANQLLEVSHLLFCIDGSMSEPFCANGKTEKYGDIRLCCCQEKLCNDKLSEFASWMNRKLFLTFLFF